MDKTLDPCAHVLIGHLLHIAQPNLTFTLCDLPIGTVTAAVLVPTATLPDRQQCRHCLAESIRKTLRAMNPDTPSPGQQLLDLLGVAATDRPHDRPTADRRKQMH